MQCEEVREQFTDYVIDSLQEPRRSQVTKHLSTCASCRTEAEELKSLWMTLGTIPSAEPGPELRARFNVMLEAYKHGREQAPSLSFWHTVNSWMSRWWPQQPVLQFGAALGLLVIGILVGHEFRSTVPAPVPQPNAEIIALRSELTQMQQMFALSLMQQQSASDRLRGVNWSYQVQQPSSEILAALLTTLMHDPNVNLRLATVDALRQFGNQLVVRRGVVDALAKEDSPMVQIALMDLAVDLHETETIPALRQITKDAQLDNTVRDRAQKSLAALE